MRQRSQYLLTASLLLPLLAITSLSVEAQDAESLHRSGELEAVKNNAADSDEDKPYSANRQGYGHIRQGNTSSEDDNFGRSHNPYGGESREEIQSKALDRFRSPEWRLGIDLKEPRRIEIERGGTKEEYWYVLFRVTNDNYRRKMSESAEGEIEDVFQGNVPERGTDRTLEMQEEYEGIGVWTNISLFVELLTIDALASPEDADMMEKLKEEASRFVGSDIESAGRDADEAKADKIAEERYKKARVAVGDVADAFVLSKIAEAEGMWQWNGAKKESTLYPASAFKREVSYVYNLEATRLDGPRCLPKMMTTVDGNGNAHRVEYFAGVYSDGSFGGYFSKSEERVAESQGITLVTSQDDSRWGMMTTLRYNDGDVVDRFGRILSPGQPGYLRAKTAGGEVRNGNASANVSANLAQLIGTIARGPRIRTYKEGDRVLMNYDTGVSRPDRPNQNWMINGKIVNFDNQKSYQKVVDELTRSARGPDKDKEIGQDFQKAAASSMVGSTTEIDSNTSFGGQVVVGQPVKQLDHLGRPIKSLVTYQAGEMISEVEYNIYAAYFPKDIVDAHPDDPWTRPLRHDDLLIGMPKIKMGRVVDVSIQQPERIRRMVGEEIVENFATGRIYDPRNEALTVDAFLRDPDGSFFTCRTAPVPSSAGLSKEERYIYAPYGAPDDGGVPVPLFDRFGVWEDYTDPETGERIVMVDSNGAQILDHLGQPVYAKAFEYEWIYQYEYEPAEDVSASQWFPEVDEVVGAMQEEDMDFVIDSDSGRLIGPVLHTMMVKKSYPDPMDSSKMIEEEVVSRKSLTKDTRTGETLVEFEAGDGMRVETISVPKYVADGIRAALDGQANRGIARSDFNIDRPSVDSRDDMQILKTFDRWTLPPPLVHTVDGKPVVETKLEVTIGPGRQVNGEGAPRALLHNISERWGAFIFKAPVKGWDYCNVQVRGLRPSVTRRGRNEVKYNAPRPSDPTNADNQLDRAFFKQRWETRDWVYFARFERLGDEFDVEADRVRPVREQWFLRGSNEINPGK